jgi:hypothetical protein
MPSAAACSRSAAMRASPPAGGKSGAASPSPSRYSQMTGLSNSARPSSAIRQGTLDSGLSRTRSAGKACGLHATASISPSRRRAMAQAITFRT